MIDQDENTVLKELQKIPGVGKAISHDLFRLGIGSIRDLKDRDAEELYFKFCVMEGRQVDRCWLYVLRGAVYYASNEEHDPALLKWWNWKDH